MRFQHIVIMVAFPLLLSGCAVGQAIKNNIQGSHYLQTKNYTEGAATFEEAVALEPDNPQPNYYLGRFLLAEKKYKQALPYLEKAATLDPEDLDYLFWHGVALGESGKLKQERKRYETILKIKEKHLQALIYLGHNQLKSGEYETALATYQKALEIWPYSPSALYNRALIAKILKRSTEEKAGWLAYLSVYPSGALAIRATDHLNRLEDFSYRNQYLGARTITLTKIWFTPFTGKIAPGSLPSLDVVGATAVNMNKGKLQVVVYLLNDKEHAKARAVAIKKYLLEKFPSLSSRGIGISWFAQPETLTIQGKKLKDPDSVRFFLSGLKKAKKKNRKNK